MNEPWNACRWNARLLQLPEPHILQTWQWAQIKAEIGWKPIPLEINGASTAMVLEREVKMGGFAAISRILYVPKGPCLDWADVSTRKVVLDALENLARTRRAIFIKMDPDVILGKGVPGQPHAEESHLGSQIQQEITVRGWRYSTEQIQFRNTFHIDLTVSEEELLQRMKQKTRYNIRLAERKGVQIYLAGVKDLPLLYQMYAETSARDGFIIRERAYYLRLWELFLQAGFAQPLIATVDEQPVAGLILFLFGTRAWYMYGMSSDLHREKMPNYLLQWHAIMLARQKGCLVYDLWGAPEVFDETDPMWGVYRFKEGLGGVVIRNLGAWDFVSQPVLYGLYMQALPKLLAVMRRRRRQQIQHEIN